MNAHHQTTIRRTLAVLTMLAMITVAGCGSTTTPDSTANVASPIVDASGTSTPDTLPDGSSPTIVPGDTAPGGTTPGGTVPPPVPTPTNPPPPPTTTVPPPVAPITVDLMPAGQWTLRTDASDGAGGSGEYRQNSATSVGLRSWAWHGYNGSNSTRASFRAQHYVGPALSELGTDLALVTVRFRAVGSGTIKAPWDRSARAIVEASAGVYGDPIFRRLADVEVRLATEQDEPLPFGFDQVGEMTFYVTADDPDLFFTLDAECHSWSGAQAFALLNEGYCDMYEAGSVSMVSVEATIRSIEWMDANGVDYPAPPQ